MVTGQLLLINWETHPSLGVLNRVSDATLPSHESEKSLADQFASFFTNKIKKIRDNFASSGTEYDVNPPSDPPQITVFRQVSEDAVDKIKINQTTIAN